MRSARITVGLLTSTVAAVALAVAIALPADGAAAPGWRIVKALKDCGDGSLESVTATGPDDAWALGQPNPDATAPSCWADVEHWNGAYWKRVPVPPGLALDGFEEFFTQPIAASSGTDAWIFPVALTKTDSLVYYALQWSGKHWHKVRLPAGLVVQSAVAPGPRDAWVFGQTYGRDGTAIQYDARFNGRSWRQVRLPGVVESVSSVSAKAIWAVGPTLKTASDPPAKQAMIAMRWNGRSWRTLRVPVPKAGSGATNPTFVKVAAVGPRDVWVSYVISSTRSVPSAGLLQWNGVRWRRIIAPSAIQEIDALAQDGAGGVWLLANVGQDWYHYSAGRWTRTLVPTPKGYNDEMFSLAWVPGTTQMWSVGEADGNDVNATLGVITRYGG